MRVLQLVSFLKATAVALLEKPHLVLFRAGAVFFAAGAPLAVRPISGGRRACGENDDFIWVRLLMADGRESESHFLMGAGCIHPPLGRAEQDH
jgi:hypothetical protein